MNEMEKSTSVKRMTILTDVGRMDSSQLPGQELHVSYCPSGLQNAGAAIAVFLRSFSYDYALLRFEPFGVYLFCLLKLLVPFNRCRLVTLDLFVKPARCWRDRLLLRVTRVLLRRVHLFIVHVRDTRRYQRHLQLAECRFRYVPYKINQYDLIVKTEVSDNGCIFSGGVSRRDFTTLFEAMRGLPYRLVVVTLPNSVLALHGSSLDESLAPPNVEVIRGDGSMQILLQHMARARLVVIPLQKDILTQAGIAVYLLAMALRKCVIISSGPGVDDLLDGGQAMIVPAGDGLALRATIETAMGDDALRKRFADTGYAYAMALGGDERFRRSLLEELARDASERRR